tara:strand:- start:247 stop:552 length:306 start_codon:yes stop_codon:yes gene_type:complete
MRRSIKKYSFKKDLKQALTKYNKIIISDQSNDLKDDFNSDNGTHQGTIKKTHWRRGHFRELPISHPKRLQPKLIWIRPTLVKSSLKSEVLKKSYQGVVANT